MAKWMKDHEKTMHLLMHLLVAAYGVGCLVLYYFQSVADLTVQGEIPYQSDLPLHLFMIIEDGWYYSFTAYAYEILYTFCGKSTIGIALMLALFSYFTVYVTDKMICYLWNRRQSDFQTLLLAQTLVLVMPVYLRLAGDFRYVSYQCANIWHNSTYICMRFFALMTLLLYFKLEEKYRTGLTWKDWASFALLNVICTGIKPSFLLAYSPIVGIFLLVDLFKKVPFTKILIFGSALLPSGLVILWQNAVLFGNDTGNGIGFDPWYTFSLHANRPKIAVICSVLFCALVIVITCKQLLQDKKYLFIVLMSGLGFLEALCLTELGSRAVDGNFLWGYSFCLSVLFTVCAVKWLSLPQKGAGLAVKVGLAVVYGWHLYCGLYFFLSLVGGSSYWMQ